MSQFEHWKLCEKKPKAFIKFPLPSLFLGSELRTLLNIYGTRWKRSVALNSVLCSHNQEQQKFCPGKSQPKSEVFGVLGSSKLHSTHAAEVFFFPSRWHKRNKSATSLRSGRGAGEGGVSFELKAAPLPHRSIIFLGSGGLREWLPCCVCLHNRYFLFKRQKKKRGFPNNLVRTGVL